MRNMKPFFSSDGILRVGGRLSRIQLPSNIHQQILPKRHHLTELVVQHQHEQAGQQHDLSLIHENYWILCEMTTVKHYMLKCA